MIERILTSSKSHFKPASSAPHTGFHRISAQRTTVIMDTGPPADASPLIPGHAGTLSFEMSVGSNRMIVNCGGLSDPIGNSGLSDALRSTAAHSTLTVSNIHSSDLLTGGGFGKRQVYNVEVRRREHNRNVLIEATHDGYSQLFGLTHRRSLYLDRNGTDLRGEDILYAEAATGKTFDIRFHLHPDVRASLSEDGHSALLKLPTGRGWRLNIAEAQLAIANSIYFGGLKRRTNLQIVISGSHTLPQTITKWRLSREG